jgi:hypothetical protein
MRSQTVKRAVFCAVCVLAMIAPSRSDAQFQMPDAKDMSGIPRPVSDLPNGSVSIRLIRGSLSNNIAGHPVDLLVNGAKQTVKTDESGRAQFDRLPSGATVKAVADVDGEHLESQAFPAPAQGGVRLMLVATDKNAAPATTPNAPAVTGQVVLTNQSRIVMEPGDEAVNVFYLLDINNTARVPVNPPAFEFDLPADARGAGIMEGSTPQARVEGHRVSVAGPFAPGHTFVQVGTSLPSESGSVEVTQRFPANLESLAVIAQKTGDTKLSSAQLTNQREMPAENQTFIAATGPAVPAGQPITVTLSGLPHRSAAPRIIALLLAGGIALVGFMLAGRPKGPESGRGAERQRLTARREKLLNELARLEADHRRGKVDEHRFAGRREEIVAALESIYGALDDDQEAIDSGMQGSPVATVSGASRPTSRDGLKAS